MINLKKILRLSQLPIKSTSCYQLSLNYKVASQLFIDAWHPLSNRLYSQLANSWPYSLISKFLVACIQLAMGMHPSSIWLCVVMQITAAFAHTHARTYMYSYIAICRELLANQLQTFLIECKHLNKLYSAWQLQLYI